MGKSHFECIMDAHEALQDPGAARIARAIRSQSREMEDELKAHKLALKLVDREHPGLAEKVLLEARVILGVEGP